MMFIIKMNNLAQDIQLSNTAYVNPHGLNNKNNKSTAYDVAMLSNFALKNHLFAKIVNTKIFFTQYHDSKVKIYLKG